MSFQHKTTNFAPKIKMNHMNTLCSYMCTYSQEGLSRENIVCNHNHFTNNKKTQNAED